MIVAPTGPGLAVFAVIGIRRGGAEGFVLIKPLGRAVAAIGIAVRLDENHRLAQLAFDRFALRGGEVIDEQHHRVYAAGFVAVNAITHVNDHGHLR